MIRFIRSPVRRYTPQEADIDAIIDVRAVFQQGHRDLALEKMPPLLLPTKGRYGLIDYEKMFCPDLKVGQDIFDLRGIDRQSGAIVPLNCCIPRFRTESTRGALPLADFNLAYNHDLRSLTACCSSMQATRMVDDHVVDCFRYGRQGAN